MNVSIVSMAMRSSLVALLVLLVAACAAPPQGPVFEPVAFRDRAPYLLDVARVHIVETPTHVRGGDISERLETPPVEAARAWARDRLQASGQTDRVLRYTIRRATIVETQLPRTGGVTGVFRVDQGQRFDVVLDVQVDVVDGTGRTLSSIEGRAERFATAPENLTYTERRLLWHRLVRDAANDLDRELTSRAGDFLARYMR